MRDPVTGGSEPHRETVPLLDLNLGRSFGRVNAGLGIGDLVYGWFAIDTGAFPRRIQVSAAFSAFQPDERYVNRQTASASHRFVIEPRQFAVVPTVFLGLVEWGTIEQFSGLVERQVLEAGTTIGAQIQLAERICVEVGGTVTAPLVQSTMSNVDPGIAAYGGFVFAMDSWDLELTGAVGDIAGAANTLLSVGIEKRWGIWE